MTSWYGYENIYDKMHPELKQPQSLTLSLKWSRQWNVIVYATDMHTVENISYTVFLNLHTLKRNNINTSFIHTRLQLPSITFFTNEV